MQESGRAQNLEQEESATLSDLNFVDFEFACEHEIDDLWGGEKCKVCGAVFNF